MCERPVKESAMARYEDRIEKQKTKKSHFARNLVLTLEALAIVLSVLGRSRIARFLSAKATLGLVVEVTDRFGKAAGHRLSTIIAAIVAEPLIIAYVLAGILVVIDLIVLLIRKRRR